MAEHKRKFAISMEAELLRRVDSIAQQREESRSAVMERIVKGGIREEEAFLMDMQNPAYRAILQAITSSPRVMRAAAMAVGEELTEDQIRSIMAKAPGHVQRGKRARVQRKDHGPMEGGTA